MNPFDQPIPGQSLTTEPRNNPWEQPPEMPNLEDVTKYYIERLADPDIIDDFATLCESGLPLKPIVETITTSGTMRGLHTVDAAMLVGPIIHEFLKQAITAQGVEVDDDGIDYQKQAEEKELERFQLLTMRYLEDNPDDSDPGKQLLSGLVEEQPEEGMTPEEKPKGLMAKG